MIEVHFLSVNPPRSMGSCEMERKEKVPKENLPVKVCPGSAVKSCRTVINAF